MRIEIESAISIIFTKVQAKVAALRVSCQAIELVKITFTVEVPKAVLNSLVA